MVKCVQKFLKNLKDLSRLRSFLGLVNQLGHMLPDLAGLTVLMRQLLCKDMAFLWTDEINAEFE